MFTHSQNIGGCVRKPVLVEKLVATHSSACWGDAQLAIFAKFRPSLPFLRPELLYGPASQLVPKFTDSLRRANSPLRGWEMGCKKYTSETNSIREENKPKIV